MAVEGTINSLNAYQSGLSLPAQKAGKSAGHNDDKPKYEDPISKKLKSEESHPLTDGSEVALLGAQKHDLPQSGNASAKKATNAYEITAKHNNGENTSPKVDDVPPYAKAAQQIREAQQERAEKAQEEREEKESRVLQIIKDRIRDGELPKE